MLRCKMCRQNVRVSVVLLNSCQACALLANGTVCYRIFRRIERFEKSDGPLIDTCPRERNPSIIYITSRGTIKDTSPLNEKKFETALASNRSAEQRPRLFINLRHRNPLVRTRPQESWRAAARVWGGRARGTDRREERRKRKKRKKEDRAEEGNESVCEEGRGSAGEEGTRG